jgi:hypothetical protein
MDTQALEGRPASVAGRTAQQERQAMTACFAPASRHAAEARRPSNARLEAVASDGHAGPGGAPGLGRGTHGTAGTPSHDSMPCPGNPARGGGPPPPQRSSGGSRVGWTRRPWRGARPRARDVRHSRNAKPWHPMAPCLAPAIRHAAEARRPSNARLEAVASNGHTGPGGAPGLGRGTHGTAGTPSHDSMPYPGEPARGGGPPPLQSPRANSRGGSTHRPWWEA